MDVVESGGTMRERLSRRWAMIAVDGVQNELAQAGPFARLQDFSGAIGGSVVDRNDRTELRAQESVEDQRSMQTRRFVL